MHHASGVESGWSQDGRVHDVLRVLIYHDGIRFAFLPGLDSNAHVVY